VVTGHVPDVSWVNAASNFWVEVCRLVKIRKLHTSEISRNTATTEERGIAYSYKTSVTSSTTQTLTNFNIYALKMEAALTSETYATSSTAIANPRTEFIINNELP
jgi:hypothetical protein